MKKRVKGRVLSRKRDQRRALLRSLVRSLIWEEKIVTTLAKAKEARKLAERLIHRAKEQSLVNIRYVHRYLDKKAAQKLLKEVAPRYLNRQGGYTRIVKLGQRKKDAAPIALLELVEPLEEAKE